MIISNNNKYKKICSLDTILVKKRHSRITTHNWNVFHGDKWFVAWNQSLC